VADGDRTFTEAEHFALLTDAVTREVAKATEDSTTTIDGLTSRIDVLEAENAAETAAKDTVNAEFAAFKAETERLREIDARKADRVAQIRAVASSDLPESYFSDERVQRWAEMADEQFNALLDDLSEVSLVGLTSEQAAQLTGLSGAAKRDKLAELIASRRAANGTGRPETAAFTGGASPTDVEQDSTFGRYLTHRGLLPGAAK
jgi:hypothetical protein